VLDARGNAPLDYLQAGPERGPSGTSLEQVRAYQESAKLLRAAGADESFKYTSAITLGRGDIRIPIFRKGTNVANQFTLLEALGEQYLARTGPSPGAGPGYALMTYLPSPDFKRIAIRAIRKIGSNDSAKVEVLDLAEALSAGNCPKDRLLEWGDIVEVPEAGQRRSPWHGIDQSLRNTFVKCLTRRVSVVVAGQTNAITLVPAGALPALSSRLASAVPMPGRRYGSSPESRPALRRGADGELTIASFWALEVIQESGLLRTSSDLAHVKVTRSDTSTRWFTVNLAGIEPGSANDLWLRDNDVLEIPEKE
jgi:hypothetical protein